MPRGRRWTPGPPRQTAREKLEELYAWAKNYDGEIDIYVQDPKKLFTEEGVAKTTYLEFGSGENVHLAFHPTKSRHSAVLMLTNLNEAELAQLKQLFDLAFEWALPVVQLRDREAREALETHGDDVNPRNYRAVPQFVVRRQPVGQHGEIVLDGLADVPGMGGSRDGDPTVAGSGQDGGPGYTEPEVVEDPEEDRFTQNYEASYYESQEPGGLGENPTGPSGLQISQPPAVDPASYPRPPSLPGAPGGGSEESP